MNIQLTYDQSASTLELLAAVNAVYGSKHCYAGFPVRCAATAEAAEFVLHLQSLGLTSLEAWFRVLELR